MGIYSIIINEQPPLNRFSLSFTKKNLNRTFDEFHTDRSLSFVRGSLLLAIGLYFLFAWLDPLIVPDSEGTFMMIRIVSCLFFSGVIGLTFSRWGHRNFQFLMSMVVLFAGLGIMWMIILAESAGVYTFYAALILTIMYAHTLLRIRFGYASLTTWFLVFLYMVVTWSLDTISFEFYMNNIFFLMSANLMGMFASYWLEYYMKAVFWKEQLLLEKTAELQKEHQRKTAELEDARLMQLNMLPQQLPDFNEYLFSFSMKAASEVGGDYYDYHLSEDNTLTFGLGDATGHGLKAGIMVTAIKLIFAEHAGHDPLIWFLRRASNSIRLMGFRKLYMAFAIGRLYNDDRLELAGAGMPPALVYRATTRIVEEIPLKGMPLGNFVSYPYTLSETMIHPGDILLLMTDGLAELFNDGRIMFGFDRIKAMLEDMAGDDLTPQQMIEYFYRESNNWLQGTPQSDDMTFFIFKRKAVEAAASQTIPI